MNNPRQAGETSTTIDFTKLLQTYVTDEIDPYLLPLHHHHDGLLRHNIADGLLQQGNTPPPLVHKDGHPASYDRLIYKPLYRRYRPCPLRRQRPRHRRRRRSRHLRRQRLHQLGITFVMIATRRERTNQSGGLITNDVL
ncbi:hypothetical protein [Oryza sativa Japonica Group]|uniref:Uncharacterized protein n=1 Tax=Oryza sativa subsp. japonica TaxID=39947 RepID=Q5ZC16_ORYSJ|nr:hypothetical protein [Oryza sativa Japonica Group]